MLPAIILGLLAVVATHLWLRHRQRAQAVEGAQAPGPGTPATAAATAWRACLAAVPWLLLGGGKASYASDASTISDEASTGHYSGSSIVHGAERASAGMHGSAAPGAGGGGYGGPQNGGRRASSSAPDSPSGLPPHAWAQPSPPFGMLGLRQGGRGHAVGMQSKRRRASLLARVGGLLRVGSSGSMAGLLGAFGGDDSGMPHTPNRRASATGMINQFLFGNSHGPVGGGPGGGGGAGAPGPSPNVLAEWSAMHRKPAFSELRENEGRIQVLSVDDEPINQQVMHSLLWAQDYELVAVESGEAALEFITDSPALPDIVLLDVTLPGMSGFEVTRRIREEHSNCELPIIMITCSSLEEDVIKGLELGANDYMTKPLRHSELMARIRTQLALKRSVRMATEATRNLHLLRSILPPNVIAQLKRGVTLIAQFHENVTILFSDIRGFTNLASEWPTEKIIVMLNEMFTAFDELCEVIGVYKVETIGDAYMIVSGHDGVPDHASRMLRMARSMIDAVSSMRGHDGRPLQIRIGVHTGPAHSGVVGVTRPRYCFFGDTVNTASRMESHGFPMSVHVSESTFQEATAYQAAQAMRGEPAPEDDFAPCSAREIKGKGVMKTYLLKYGAWEEGLKSLARSSAVAPTVSAPLGAEGREGRRALASARKSVRALTPASNNPSGEGPVPAEPGFSGAGALMSATGAHGSGNMSIASFKRTSTMASGDGTVALFHRSPTSSSAHLVQQVSGGHHANNGGPNQPQAHAIEAPLTVPQPAVTGAHGGGMGMGTGEEAASAGASTTTQLLRPASKQNLTNSTATTTTTILLGGSAGHTGQHSQGLLRMNTGTSANSLPTTLTNATASSYGYAIEQYAGTNTSYVSQLLGTANASAHDAYNYLAMNASTASGAGGGSWPMQGAQLTSNSSACNLASQGPTALTFAHGMGQRGSGHGQGAERSGGHNSSNQHAGSRDGPTAANFLTSSSADSLGGYLLPNGVVPANTVHAGNNRHLALLRAGSPNQQLPGQASGAASPLPDAGLITTQRSSYSGMDQPHHQLPAAGTGATGAGAAGGPPLPTVCETSGDEGAHAQAAAAAQWQQQQVAAQGQERGEGSAGRAGAIPALPPVSTSMKHQAAGSVGPGGALAQVVREAGQALSTDPPSLAFPQLADAYASREGSSPRATASPVLHGAGPMPFLFAGGAASDPSAVGLPGRRTSFVSRLLSSSQVAVGADGAAVPQAATGSQVPSSGGQTGSMDEMMAIAGRSTALTFARDSLFPLNDRGSSPTNSCAGMLNGSTSTSLMLQPPGRVSDNWGQTGMGSNSKGFSGQFTVLQGAHLGMGSEGADPYTGPSPGSSGAILASWMLGQGPSAPPRVAPSSQPVSGLHAMSISSAAPSGMASLVPSTVGSAGASASGPPDAEPSRPGTGASEGGAGDPGSQGPPGAPNTSQAMPEPAALLGSQGRAVHASSVSLASSVGGGFGSTLDAMSTAGADLLASNQHPSGALLNSQQTSGLHCSTMTIAEEGSADEAAAVATGTGTWQPIKGAPASELAGVGGENRGAAAPEGPTTAPGPLSPTSSGVTGRTTLTSSTASMAPSRNTASAGSSRASSATYWVGGLLKAAVSSVGGAIGGMVPWGGSNSSANSAAAGSHGAPSPRDPHGVVGGVGGPRRSISMDDRGARTSGAGPSRLSQDVLAGPHAGGLGRSTSQKGPTQARASGDTSAQANPPVSGASRPSLDSIATGGSGVLPTAASLAKRFGWATSHDGLSRMDARGSIDLYLMNAQDPRSGSPAPNVGTTNHQLAGRGSMGLHPSPATTRSSCELSARSSMAAPNVNGGYAAQVALSSLMEQQGAAAPQDTAFPLPMSDLHPQSGHLSTKELPVHSNSAPSKELQRASEHIDLAGSPTTTSRNESAPATCEAPTVEPLPPGEQPPVLPSLARTQSLNVLGQSSRPGQHAGRESTASSLIRHGSTADMSHPSNTDTTSGTNASLEQRLSIQNQRGFHASLDARRSDERRAFGKPRPSSECSTISRQSGHLSVIIPSSSHQSVVVPTMRHSSSFKARQGSGEAPTVGGAGDTGFTGRPSLTQRTSPDVRGSAEGVVGASPRYSLKGTLSTGSGYAYLPSKPESMPSHGGQALGSALPQGSPKYSTAQMGMISRTESKHMERLETKILELAYSLEEDEGPGGWGNGAAMRAPSMSNRHPSSSSSRAQTVTMGAVTMGSPSHTQGGLVSLGSGNYGETATNAGGGNMFQRASFQGPLGSGGGSMARMPSSNYLRNHPNMATALLNNSSATDSTSAPATLMAALGRHVTSMGAQGGSQGGSASSAQVGASNVLIPQSSSFREQGGQAYPFSDGSANGSVASTSYTLPGCGTPVAGQGGFQSISRQLSIDSSFLSPGGARPGHLQGGGNTPVTSAHQVPLHGLGASSPASHGGMVAAAPVPSRLGSTSHGGSAPSTLSHQANPNFGRGSADAVSWGAQVAHVQFTDDHHAQAPQQHLQILSASSVGSHQPFFGWNPSQDPMGSQGGPAMFSNGGVYPVHASPTGSHRHSALSSVRSSYQGQATGSNGGAEGLTDAAVAALRRASLSIERSTVSSGTTSYNNSVAAAALVAQSSLYQTYQPATQHHGGAQGGPQGGAPMAPDMHATQAASSWGLSPALSLARNPCSMAHSTLGTLHEEVTGNVSDASSSSMVNVVLPQQHPQPQQQPPSDDASSEGQGQVVPQALQATGGESSAGFMLSNRAQAPGQAGGAVDAAGNTSLMQQLATMGFMRRSSKLPGLEKVPEASQSGVTQSHTSDGASAFFVTTDLGSGSVHTEPGAGLVVGGPNSPGLASTSPGRSLNGVLPAAAPTQPSPLGRGSGSQVVLPSQLGQGNATAPRGAADILSAVGSGKQQEVCSGSGAPDAKSVGWGVQGSALAAVVASSQVQRANTSSTTRGSTESKGGGPASSKNLLYTAEALFVAGAGDMLHASMHPGGQAQAPGYGIEGLSRGQTERTATGSTTNGLLGSSTSPAGGSGLPQPADNHGQPQASVAEGGADGASEAGAAAKARSRTAPFAQQQQTHQQQQQQGNPRGSMGDGSALRSVGSVGSVGSSQGAGSVNGGVERAGKSSNKGAKSRFVGKVRAFFK